MTTTAAPSPTFEQELPTDDPTREAFVDKRPKADGMTVETLRVSFAGGVDLNPLVEVDREFFKALKLGRTITLQVTGEITSKGPKLKRDKDGAATVTDTVKLTIDSIDIAPR